MSANNSFPRTGRCPCLRQKGTAAVEFALLAAIFFTLVFGIIETARLMYVYNTLQEVTRRAAAAAANVYPGNTTRIQQVKQDAVFRNSPGELVLASPVTDKNIRIDYLALTRETPTGAMTLTKVDESALPKCPAQNRQTCMRDPHANNCIRFVQVQVCDTAHTDSCRPVTSQMLLSFVDMRVPLHRATTITPVESLGYELGMLPCP
ncbi:TadE family protein [Massilia niabensis]|uniref:TadE family protein n=1 Tax=Massilia niabensis TaxID=544910 RepID=A0ABW0KZ37_9BURK